MVVAIGSEVNNFGIKGIDQYTCKIKNPENILELQKKLVTLDNIEKTNKDIGIMGVGPVGIELAFKLKNLVWLSTIFFVTLDSIPHSTVIFYLQK